MVRQKYSLAKCSLCAKKANFPIMKIKDAIFVGSSLAYRQCPNTAKPELALIGRSNVGKSSLINMVLDRKKLAKTSSRPGKTQHINHFLINDQWYLVDLPGYGWSQVSKVKKEAWKKMVTDYLLYRENLACVCVLVDSRLKPQKIDIEFINWLGKSRVPFIIIFTKADKQAKQKLQTNLTVFKQVLSTYWEALPTFLVTSAYHRTGRVALLDCINSIVHKKSSRK